MDTRETQSDPGIVDLPAGARVRRADLRFRAVRSRGPGGQSVNKVASAVQLRVAVGAIEGLDEPARQRLRRRAGRRLTDDDELLIAADTHRSQKRNRQDCLGRLADLVAAAAPPPRKRKRTRPTRGSVERRLEKKRQAGEKKRRRREFD